LGLGPLSTVEEDLMWLALVALILVGFACPAVSQTTTAPSLITMIATGWDVEAFAVVTQGPILNPQHCPIADGYVTDSSLPGYNTYYAAALAAYASNSPVSVVVFDKSGTTPTDAPGLPQHPPTATAPGTGVPVQPPCAQGRPRLIGIYLTRSGH
jgi:hypothetical protein